MTPTEMHIDALMEKIEDLESKLAKAMEALEFYAIEGNYLGGPSSWVDRSKPIVSGIHTADLFVPVYKDRGLLAREALKEIE